MHRVKVRTGTEYSPQILRPLQELEDCRCCPRACGVDRTAGELGYCRTGAGFPIASIFRHRGEEPVISGEHGICNVFFAHCNMQCIYCQNYQISRNLAKLPQMELRTVLDKIERILDQGIDLVGFVSPSHVIPQMRVIIAALQSRGYSPGFLMNTNAYDRVQTLAALAGTIDVYLPDLKYMDDELAANYSDTPGYVQVATAALKEMYRQKGAEIDLDQNGIIRSGLIVRHLVLPGHVENSKRCLRFIAEEISPQVNISLMSQYHPTPAVVSHPRLGRTLHRGEYEEVLKEMDRLGLYHGWVQDLESPGSYLPDFSRPCPFEGL